MLELYQAAGCRCSATVRETCNEQTHEQLRTLGSEDRIPFFVDHQRRVRMYESDNIVAYLEEHYNA